MKTYIVEELVKISRTELVSTLEAFEIRNEKTNNTFLYIAIHIPSKVYQDEYDQFQSTINYKKYITGRAMEYDYKVLVAGDFNMSPYEKGMTEPMGFFAFPNKEDVRPKPELILTTRELSFYNPCWRLLGDYNVKSRLYRTNGSFFYGKSTNRKLKTWHLFDQVIFPRNFIDWFDQDSLSIIENSAILADIADPKKSIDHLPLYFSVIL